MRNITQVLLLNIILLSSVDATDIRLLANNKEAVSNVINPSELRELEMWVSSHAWGMEALRPRFRRMLQRSLKRLQSNETLCDLALPTTLTEEMNQEFGFSSNKDLKNILRALRVENIIDDIFYDLAVRTMKVSSDLKLSTSPFYPRRPTNLYTRSTSGTDIEKLYEPFKGEWADEKSSCSIGRFFRLAGKFHWVSPRDRDHQILRYNFMALQLGFIELPTYHRLEALRKNDVLSWDIYLDRYFDIIANAKDRLTDSPEISSDANFHNSYPHRRAALTQRESLYSRFDSTQIIMLAQVVEKTARRLDARTVSLNFQFTEDPEGEQETYVLSPMEQYRISIRMLRKEMARLLRSEAFADKQVLYEDLVSAAFETGLLKSAELEQVLNFEDLWSKSQPKWRSYLNFAFSLAGTSTFFLPTPFNIMGAIGLVLTQSLVTGKPDPDSDDNWNAII